MIRIRIHMAPHKSGYLEPDLNPHWGKSWIRIRIETNADPQNWLKPSDESFQGSRPGLPNGRQAR
jgi:hypothetical protein